MLDREDVWDALYHYCEKQNNTLEETMKCIDSIRKLGELLEEIIIIQEQHGREIGRIHKNMFLQKYGKKLARNIGRIRFSER
ncbi:hypothetical protein J7L13_00215 [bacterium]|nr:hypothetical protein [bacterium]